MAGSGDHLGTKDVMQFLLETENEMLREQKDDIQKKLDALKGLNSKILIKLKGMEAKTDETNERWKTTLQDNLVLNEDLTKCQKTLGICQRQHSEDQSILEEEKRKLQEALEKITIENNAIKDEVISCQRALISRESELISCEREEKHLKLKLIDVEQKLRELKDVAAGTYYAELEALHLREAMIKFEDDHMSFSDDIDKSKKRGEVWQRFFSESKCNAILTQFQFQGSVKDTVMQLFLKLNTEVQNAYRTGMKVYIDKIPLSNNELALLKAVWKIGLAKGTLRLARREIIIA